MRAELTPRAIETLGTDADRGLRTLRFFLQTLGVVLAVAVSGAVVSDGGVELEAVAHSLSFVIRAQAEVRVIVEALQRRALSTRKVIVFDAMDEIRSDELE
jgi:hypothetical protein